MVWSWLWCDAFSWWIIPLSSWNPLWCINILAKYIWESTTWHFSFFYFIEICYFRPRSWWNSSSIAWHCLWNTLRYILRFSISSKTFFNSFKRFLDKLAVSTSFSFSLLSRYTSLLHTKGKVWSLWKTISIFILRFT